MTNRSRWISSVEAAILIGVPRRTLFEIISEGQLTAYKIGRVIRLREIDVNEYIARTSHPIRERN